LEFNVPFQQKYGHIRDENFIGMKCRVFLCQSKKFTLLVTLRTARKTSQYSYPYINVHCESIPAPVKQKSKRTNTELNITKKQPTESMKVCVSF